MPRLKRNANAHPITKVFSGVTLFLVVLFFYNSLLQIEATGVFDNFGLWCDQVMRGQSQ